MNYESKITRTGRELSYGYHYYSSQAVSTRTKQIGSAIHKALAPQLLIYEATHRMVTITGVDVAPDMTQAKVYLSAQRGVHKLIAKLNHKAGHLQNEIRSYLPQKRIPKLIFINDDELTQIRKIEELLED